MTFADVQDRRLESERRPPSGKINKMNLRRSYSGDLLQLHPTLKLIRNNFNFNFLIWKKVLYTPKH